jgi:hypothetical protein
MQKIMIGLCLKIIPALMVLVFFILGGCALPDPEAQQSVATASLEHEMSSGRQPGLSVIYIFQKYRSVDQIPAGRAALRMGRRGAPVTILNHQSGKKGQVFASGRSQGVGMVMEGFLKLEKAGTYGWQALANDGIRMFIDNKLIFEDPKVHADRLTPAGMNQVTKPGMHQVRIIYFQRKGTAALKLYWQPPGAEKFTLVPAKVYWH